MKMLYVVVLAISVLCGVECLPVNSGFMECPPENYDCLLELPDVGISFLVAVGRPLAKIPHLHEDFNFILNSALNEMKRCLVMLYMNDEEATYQRCIRAVVDDSSLDLRLLVSQAFFW